MATITANDFSFIRQWIHDQRPIYNEMRSWGITKTTWKSALQAIEDYMVSGFGTRPAGSIRAAIEAVTGATTSLRAQYMFVIWVNWKLYNYLGGA
jgi:hypothetical protein